MIGACIICELYVIKGTIFSVNMLCLTFMTLGGTMVTYNGIYEGLGLKDLCKRLFAHLKQFFAKTPESKLTKTAEKMGIVEAIDFLNKKLEESKPVEETKAEETKVEVVKVETATDRTIIKGV